ncbi:MAG: M1 family metallopeptidase, partial [Bacteroidota bacterium]
MKYILARLAIAYAILFFLVTYKIAEADTKLSQIDKQQYSVPYQPSRTKYHDLLHTKLEVSFDWEKQHLHGIATLKLQPHFYPQQSLELDASNMAIHSIVMLEEQVRRKLNYNYDGRKLIIDLSRTYSREEPYLLEIAYTTEFSQSKVANGTILNENKGLYFINPSGRDLDKPQQIWTQGELNTSSCWFPTIDAPNQRCTQEIYITVDDKFRTLSNGALVYTMLNEDQTRTDYWRMDLPHAPYSFMLAVGEFVDVQDEWNDIPVNYYVEPAYEPYAKSIFGHTPAMLDFFSEKLDYPYPWPKYSQVIARDFPTAAIGSTTVSIFTEALQVDDRELLDRDYDDIIAHELFHQWFGNLVACEPWPHLPLNESFAYLGAHLWRAYKYGSYARDLSIWHMLSSYLEETPNEQASLIKPYYTDPRELFNGYSYHKGSLILHMLKNYLSEEAFFKSLSHCLKKHAFASIDIHQLRKAFEEIAGEDLNWFFNQWFLAPGHPKLQVEHNYANGKLTLKMWQKQNASIPLYQLPIVVDIWLQGNKQRHKVMAKNLYNEFTWELPQQPELVHIDRNSLLVAEIIHSKTATEYQYLYYHGDNFFAKYEALAYFINSEHNAPYYQVLQDALQDDYWFFRMIAVEALAGCRDKAYSTIEASLIELSKNDGYTAVRAAAIRALSSSEEPNKYTDLYKTSLFDSSYHLVSTALYAYATTSEDAAKPAILAEFEAYDNLKIITALAGYYTTTKQLDKYNWLKDKVTRLHGRVGFEH